jgi:hypothetical protein
MTKGKHLAMILQYDAARGEWASVAASPIYEWLVERDESPFLCFKVNDVWLEFQDISNAILFKLTWCGR